MIAVPAIYTVSTAPKTDSAFALCGLPTCALLSLTREGAL